MNFFDSLMNALSYPKKMVLITVVFMVPILIGGYLIIAESSQGITITKNEKAALEYIKTLRQLYQDFPQHRGMTNAFRNGKQSFEKKILAKRKEITADIAAIDAVDEELGKKFHTTSFWNDIKSDWQTLKNKSFTADPKQVFSEHSALIAKLYSLMEHIGNESGLVLDAHLQSHYLMEAILHELPVITENLGQGRGLGSGIAASQQITQQQQARLYTLISYVSSYSKALEHDIEELTTAGQYKLDAELNRLLSDRSQRTEAFVETVKKELLTASFITIDAAKLFDLGTQAIKANYKVYDALVPVLDSVFDERLSELRNHRLLIMAIFGVSLFIAMLLFHSFYNSVTNTISNLKNSAQKISGGDLTVNIKSQAEDESKAIVDSLNTMTSSLNTMMKDIGNGAASLASSSQQLSATTTQVSSNSGEQQIQTEQIATAMNEMTATVQDIARNAELLAAEVKNAQDQTQEGSGIINNTIESINTLATGIENAATVVANLEQSSNQIGSILSVIKEVAEQTNLLALNAAIEAARAGDHGRGFAVVADEVRTLATRSQESAEQIQDMVNTLQKNTQEASSVMHAEKSKAEHMSVTTQTATTSLQNIVNSMGKISDMSVQLAAAAEEQGSVSEEVNHNVVTVSDLSSQNLIGMNEVSTSSDELAALATHLESIVRQFKTN
jgi:methyl-accepting chemotaxis protein